MHLSSAIGRVQIDTPVHASYPAPTRATSDQFVAVLTRTDAPTPQVVRHPNETEASGATAHASLARSTEQRMRAADALLTSTAARGGPTAPAQAPRGKKSAQMLLRMRALRFSSSLGRVYCSARGARSFWRRQIGLRRALIFAILACRCSLLQHCFAQLGSSGASSHESARLRCLELAQMEPVSSRAKLCVRARASEFACVACASAANKAVEVLARTRPSWIWRARSVDGGSGASACVRASVGLAARPCDKRGPRVRPSIKAGRVEKRAVSTHPPAPPPLSVSRRR